MPPLIANAGSSPARIRPFQIVGDSLAFCWTHRLPVLCLLAPMALLLACVDTFGVQILVGDAETHYVATALANLVLAFLKLLPLTLFAISFHRLILLGEEAVPRYGLWRWGRRETRFLGWTLGGALPYLLCLLCIRAVFVLTDFASLVNPDTAFGEYAVDAFIFALSLPGLYVLNRLAVLLPATATGNSLGLKGAWRLTAANGWRLTLATMLVPVLVQRVSVLEMSFPGRDYLLALVNYLVLALGIVIVSLSYKHLEGHSQ